MSKAFSAYTYDDAVEWFNTRVPKTGQQYFPATNPRRPPSAKSATEFFLGNHWQDANGFIGQLPPVTLPGASQITADIKAGFVSENVIQEVVETHVGGILGREPTWGFLKAEGETDRSNKESFENVTGETLTRWWNDRKCLRDLQQAIQVLVCEGIVVRRIFFPKAVLGTQITAADLPAALKFIHVSYHTSDVAGVFTDDDTQKQIGIFLFDEKDSSGDVRSKAAELSFIDDSGNTICRIVRDKGVPTESSPYQLGGRLLVDQLDRRALITDQVQSSQRALNLAHTMMMRNVNMAGHRERTIINAQPPINVKGVDVVSNKATREPGTYKTGAGAVMFLMGYPIRDEEGNIIDYTNPNVTVSDPVPVITFKDTIDAEKQAIYSQCHQRHVMIVDKADTSGRAREVARREFERSLKETKTGVDASGRWELETVLWMAAQILGQSSKYLALRADFNCIIDAGDVDPEKQKTAVLLRTPGGPKMQPIVSDETARSMCGIEDPAAEFAKIEQEDKSVPEGTPPATKPDLNPAQQQPQQVRGVQ